MSDEIMTAQDTISEDDANLLQEIAEDVADAEFETADDTDTHDPTEELMDRISELEERLRAAENDRERRERELTCVNLLRDAGLPPRLLPAVMASRDMAETVALISEAVREAVESEVSRRCRTDVPAAGTRAPLTREELIRLPVAQLQRMRDSGAVL